MVILGTAQLGLKYGANNEVGLLDEIQAKNLLETAISQGITAFDTAAAYGSSEQRIGKFLGELPKPCRVISKLIPLEISSLRYRDSSNWSVDIRQSIESSLTRLRTDTIDTLLVHRWCNWKAFNYSCRTLLNQLKAENTLKKIGASISTIEEFTEASNDPVVDVIQLPCNLLDWRWQQPDIEQMLKNCGKEIHVRSIYLQGILLADSQTWPVIETVNAMEILFSLDKMVKTLDRRSRADLCIGYMRAQSWMNGMIIGAETPDQVKESVDLFNNKSLTVEEVEFVRDSMPRLPEAFLNPALWPKK